MTHNDWHAYLLEVFHVLYKLQFILELPLLFEGIDLRLRRGWSRCAHLHPRKKRKPHYRHKVGLHITLEEGLYDGIYPKLPHLFQRSPRNSESKESCNPLPCRNLGEVHHSHFLSAFD